VNETPSVSSTKRSTSAGAEEILGLYFPVLDHGFVSLVDYMGTDADIERAARVSYGAGTRQVSKTRGLIRYLRRHKHTTPSEMVELKFHCCMPIFIARQWIRHRTANVNEYSGRYSIMPDTFYRPTVEEVRKQSKANRQGGEERFEDESRTAAEFVKFLEDSEALYERYSKLTEAGVSRELARIGLPVSVYTQWYWKCDLHNLLHFLMLRADPHAQYEIRAYADVMLETVKRWVPLTYQAFEDYSRGGLQLSAQGLAVVKRLIAGEAVTQATSGMNAREWRELMASLGRTA